MVKLLKLTTLILVFMTHMKIFAQPNPNPIKIYLNETKISDLKENYQIKSTDRNFHVEDYQDHYVVDTKNNKEAQEWKYAIVTSNQNGKIESVIYRFKNSKFNGLSNFLQNETNIKISNTPVKNGKHITLDRGEYYIFLWQKSEEKEFDLQYATKDFMSKLRRSKF